MDNFLLSVIIPSYNNAAYLPELFDSLIKQKIKNSEILIIDDASSDNSRRIIESYKNKLSDNFELTTIYNKTNIGINKNFIKGIINSRGKYIKIIAGDDFIEPNSLGEPIEIMEKNNFNFLTCDTRVVNKFSDIINYLPNKNRIKYYALAPGGQFDILCWNNFVPHPGTFFSRKVFYNLKHQINKYLITFEWPLWLKATLNGYKMNYYPYLFCNYRRHPNNTSKYGWEYNEILLKEWIDVYEKIILPNKNKISRKSFTLSKIIYNYRKSLLKNIKLGDYEKARRIANIEKLKSVTFIWNSLKKRFSLK